MYSKPFAILAFAAACLPTAFACTIGCQYLNNGKWVYMTHEIEIGETLCIMGHCTMIGEGCKPETTSWSDAKIYYW